MESVGFGGGDSGTQTRTLGGVTFGNPRSTWPTIEFIGRVRWINDAGASVVLEDSQFHYSAQLPAPGGAALLGCGGLLALRRRRK